MGQTPPEKTEIAVLGAGLAGIATAYYLCRHDPALPVALIDCRSPMSYTSAQSGDNYRNWWPHPTMTAFTNHSIDLLEEIAQESGNRIGMTRRGYLLATRSANIDELVENLHNGYDDSEPDTIRVHTRSVSESYSVGHASWESATRGVDVLSNPELIAASFPSISTDVRNAIHVRRAGDIAGQQLGQYMLERLQETACRRISATVTGIHRGLDYWVDLRDKDGERRLKAESIINAAGPFVSNLAAMLDVELPVRNVYHQKIAFEDKRGVIPRDLPFVCDLDGFEFEWDKEDRELLAEDPETQWLTEPLPGGMHCRPEGGEKAEWIKIGWAYNQQASEPQHDLENEPLKNDQFPEIAMRAAARLNAGLRDYVEDFPSKFVHYGGYYPMTPENWPLIGPMGLEGAYVVGALSGFGSMSACAAGALCASWVQGRALPTYANDLSLSRYTNEPLMQDLAAANSRGIL